MSYVGHLLVHVSLLALDCYVAPPSAPAPPARPPSIPPACQAKKQFNDSHIILRRILTSDFYQQTPQDNSKKIFTNHLTPECYKRQNKTKNIEFFGSVLKNLANRSQGLKKKRRNIQGVRSAICKYCLIRTSKCLKICDLSINSISG